MAMSEALSAIYALGIIITLGLAGVWMMVLMDFQDDDADIGIIVPVVLGAMVWPLTWIVSFAMYFHRKWSNR
jgi:hypothetical protein